LTRKLMNNPKHWRDRAEETRVHAEQMYAPEARRLMLEIAAGYDRLAEEAEERLPEARDASNAASATLTISIATSCGSADGDNREA
jgi:CHASE3 domain sensor protein